VKRNLGGKKLVFDCGKRKKKKRERRKRKKRTRRGGVKEEGAFRDTSVSRKRPTRVDFGGGPYVKRETQRFHLQEEKKAS